MNSIIPQHHRNSSSFGYWLAIENGKFVAQYLMAALISRKISARKKAFRILDFK
jgi:hypothetical protein